MGTARLNLNEAAQVPSPTPAVTKALHGELVGSRYGRAKLLIDESGNTGYEE